MSDALIEDILRQHKSYLKKELIEEVINDLKNLKNLKQKNYWIHSYIKKWEAKKNE